MWYRIEYSGIPAFFLFLRYYHHDYKEELEGSRSVEAKGRKVMNVLFEQVVLYMPVAKKASYLVSVTQKHSNSDEIVIKMGRNFPLSVH